MSSKAVVSFMDYLASDVDTTQIQTWMYDNLLEDTLKRVKKLSQ